MRLPHATIMLVSIALSAGATDAFHLVDAAGNQVVPFEFAEGKELAIAEATYKISKVLTTEERHDLLPQSTIPISISIPMVEAR